MKGSGVGIVDRHVIQRIQLGTLPHGTFLVARPRRDMLDALLAHLPEEPELWQVQMIGAACLGRREVMDVSVVECEL